MTLIAGISGALTIAGLLGVIYGLRRHEAAPARPTKHRRFGGRERRWLLVGGVVGVVLALATGWLVLILVVPAAAWFAVRALSNGQRRRLERLDALSEFARAVAGVLQAGRGLEQALLHAGRSASPALHAEISRLVARLRANWTTERALRGFADDIDDATGDIFVATLLMGAQRRGPGVASAVTGLAESIDAEVRARRAVEAEAQKPKTAARMITLISLGLIAVMFLSGTYVDPYLTPLGQMLLTVYAGLYLLVLLWMGRIIRTRPLPRFIGVGARQKLGEQA